MRIEVRCCCVPKKLLGWLEAPEELVFEGSVLSFRIPPRCFQPVGQPLVFERAIDVRLPVAMFEAGYLGQLLSGGGERHLALKSEETPIELLRRVPGFVENGGSPDGADAMAMSMATSLLAAEHGIDLKTLPPVPEAPSDGPGVDDFDQQQYLFHKERVEAEQLAERLGVHIDMAGDHVCQHGTAMDVHCCGCHNGFIFERDHVCREDEH